MNKMLLFPLMAVCAVPALAQSAPDPLQEGRQQGAIILRNARIKGDAVLAARSAFIEAGGNSKDFKGDVGKELAAMAAQLGSETRVGVRQALIVSQLYLNRVARLTPPAELVGQAFSEVSALYSGWAVDKSLLLALDAWAPDLAGPYLAQARDGFPDGEVRAFLLFENFTELIDTRPESEWRPSYEALLKAFPRSPEARKASERLASELKTRVGELTPPFVVAALGEPGTTYTPGSFKGHYVLLDFWATWCPDCAAEMPALHHAYARFKDKGLEILSLSFDRRVEHIAPYRQRPATPMAWKHAFLEGGFGNPMSEAYGVKSIPKPVLVGPDSRIVASGGELRGDQLEKTLAKLLGQ